MSKIVPTIVRFPISGCLGVMITHGYSIVNDFPVHFHTTFTIGLVEKGERVFLYRDTEYILKEGDIFIIHPFEPHLCSAVNKTAHTYKIISTPWPETGEVPYFTELIYHDDRIAESLRKFHTQAEYRQSGNGITDLFPVLIRQIIALSSCKNEEEGKEAMGRIIGAKAFIDEHCLEELALRDIAARACLSEFHFTRLFHRIYGMSPYAYLLMQRIKASAGMLAEGNSISAAAYGAGFCDQSHFTRLFKKHIGTTPGAYLSANGPQVSK